MLAQCFSDIPDHVADTMTDIHLLLQFVTKYFILFLIRTHSIFSQISKLNFDYCWFITPPFLYTKMSVGISGIGGCYSK